MNKKYLSLLLLVFSFLVTIVPAYADAASAEQQSVLKNRIEKFSSYKKYLEVQDTNELIAAHKNGEIALSEDQLTGIKGKYLAYLEEAFNELSKPENEFYINYLLKVSGLLPKSISPMVSNIIAVAKLDVSTDEKLELLRGSGDTCRDLVDIAVKCVVLGLYLLVAAVIFSFTGIFGNIVLIGGMLANINFIIALIAAILYPLLCVL